MGLVQVLVVCLALAALGVLGNPRPGATQDSPQAPGGSYAGLLSALQEPEEKRAPRRWDKWGFGSDGYLYDFVKRAQPLPKRFDSSRWGGGSDGHLYDFAKRFDSSRWGGGSDGHLYDFAKRFDSSRWGGGSDGHLYDFAKRFDSSRWGGGSDGHLYDFAKK